MSMHSGKNGILLQKNFAEEKVKLNKTHRNILENMHKYLQIQNKNEQIAHDCPAEHCHRFCNLHHLYLSHLYSDLTA